MTSDIEELIGIIRGLKDVTKRHDAEIESLRKENAHRAAENAQLKKDLADVNKRLHWIHSRVTMPGQTKGATSGPGHTHGISSNSALSPTKDAEAQKGGSAPAQTASPPKPPQEGQK